MPSFILVPMGISSWFSQDFDGSDAERQLEKWKRKDKANKGTNQAKKSLPRFVGSVEATWSKYQTPKSHGKYERVTNNRYTWQFSLDTDDSLAKIWADILRVMSYKMQLHTWYNVENFSNCLVFIHFQFLDRSIFYTLVDQTVLLTLSIICSMLVIGTMFLTWCMSDMTIQKVGPHTGLFFYLIYIKNSPKHLT